MTVLIGDTTNTSTTGVGPNTYGDIEYCSYIASATGYATDGYFYAEAYSYPFVIAVYDNSNNLLGYSNQISSASLGWNHVTFSTPVSITSGTTYQLAVCADDTSGSWFIGLGASAGSPWHYYTPTSAYFPTPPSTISATGAGNATTLSLYLSASAGIPAYYFRA